MMKHGFAWGRYFSSFPEDCHFEMTFDIPSHELKEAWKKRGVAGCFALVDAKLIQEKEAVKKLPIPVLADRHDSLVEILQKILKIVTKFRRKKNDR